MSPTRWVLKLYFIDKFIMKRNICFTNIRFSNFILLTGRGHKKASKIYSGKGRCWDFSLMTSETVSCHFVDRTLCLSILTFC
jgi:hypothetical protein